MSTPQPPDPITYYRMAMPPSRLLAGGMDAADVTSLWSRAEAGQAWDQAACELAGAGGGGAAGARAAGGGRWASAGRGAPPTTRGRRALR
jgi:hypothetical protein